MAGRSTPFGGGGFVKPDSVLAQTAVDLVRAHSAEAGLCRSCGAPAPCASARAAAQVLAAAGLPQPEPVVAVPVVAAQRPTAWEAPPRAGDTVVFDRGPDVPYPAGASSAA